MNDEGEKKILQAIEGLRQQQSAQHDEQLSILKMLRELLVWVKTKWEKFSRSPTWPGDSR